MIAVAKFRCLTPNVDNYYEVNGRKYQFIGQAITEVLEPDAEKFRNNPSFEELGLIKKADGTKSLVLAAKEPEPIKELPKAEAEKVAKEVENGVEYVKKPKAKAKTKKKILGIF